MSCDLNQKQEIENPSPLSRGGVFLTKEQKNLQSGNMVSYPQRTECQVLFLSRYTIWSSFYGLTQLFTEEAREVFMFR